MRIYWPVHGLTEDQGKARKEVAEVLRKEPEYTVSRYINPNLYEDKTQMEIWAQVLMDAGMPRGA